MRTAMPPGPRRGGRAGGLRIARTAGSAATVFELLWETLARNVPNMAPIASRHYQTGPRPEEFTYLRALIYAGAVPRLEHVPYLIALLPYTEGEKPRFEDRTKSDSQRVWLGRILLERAGLRANVVHIARDVLDGKADSTSKRPELFITGTSPNSDGVETPDDMATEQPADEENSGRNSQIEPAALPPPEKVYAAANYFTPLSEFKPARTARPVHLLGRGDVKQPRELMLPAAIPA